MKLVKIYYYEIKLTPSCQLGIDGSNAILEEEVEENDKLKNLDWSMVHKAMESGSAIIKFMSTDKEKMTIFVNGMVEFANAVLFSFLTANHHKYSFDSKTLTFNKPESINDPL